MDLQNLTKNQEFINIVTHQFSQAGKSDDDIKAILEEYLPEILEKQKQEFLLDLFSALRVPGQLISLKMMKTKQISLLPKIPILG